MPRRRKSDPKIVEFPGEYRGALDADIVLRGAFEQALDEVVVIGLRRGSNDLFVAASPRDERTLMMLERAKLMLVIRNRD